VNALATVLRIHQAVYERTGGLIGHRVLGVPTLLLRTVGRRTGLERVNALVYGQDGNRWLVVPSNGGQRRPPGWLVNLKARPAVEVQIGRSRRAVRALVVERDDQDFDRLWAICDHITRGRFSDYQRRTSRLIPVVVLEPTT
jgi:deazaflavin-dependent oxidoreductase (nitroreductase family)